MSRLIFGDHRNPDQELVEVFGTPGGSSSDALTRAESWAREQLATAGVATDKQVSAVAEIRRAEPRLGLKAATALAKRIV